MATYDLEGDSLTRAELENRRNHHERLALDHASGESVVNQQTPGFPDQRHRLKLLVAGSGSKGNAAVVFDRISGEGILIDAGICKRDVFNACAEGGFDLANLKGIFITHAHSDHVKNFGVIIRGLEARGITVPLFAHDRTIAASKELQKEQASVEVRSVEAGDRLSVGELSIHILPTSHDAEVSFGFRIACGQDALGYLTDTGIVLPEALEALKSVRILGLESNHDIDMLKNGPYPQMLKERVGSDRGHLSNEQAARILEQVLSPYLETVVALHISENNNTYRMPVETLRSVVARSSCNVQVTCAYQHRPVFVS